jgi:hypothetical protein
MTKNSVELAIMVRDFSDDAFPVLDREERNMIVDALNRLQPLPSKGKPGDWHPGDFVSPIEDPRHVGQSFEPKSRKSGVVDVDWEETELKSVDVPVEKLKLARRGSFSVSISEKQREMLMDALFYHTRQAPHMFSTEPGSGQIDGESERSEAEMLFKMLRELPEEDAKLQPGCLHGLCL